jgi:osmotically-inducible protein OsmY
MSIAEDKSDTTMKMDVLAELQFEPSVKITDVGVLVKDGVVTLTGLAPSHGEKLNVLRAVRRVAGVVAIADDIVISLPEFGQHSDSHIAAAAANRINWSSEIPSGAVLVTVREGWITLEGVLEWGYQKHAAESAIQNLAGVRGVSNEIRIEPTVIQEDLEQTITSAIQRNAILGDADIQVRASGSVVVLTGKVQNHSVLEEAVRVAWAAPGVHTVDNRLKVDWFWGLGD